MINYDGHEDDFDDKKRHIIISKVLPNMRDTSCQPHDTPARTLFFSIFPLFLPPSHLTFQFLQQKVANEKKHVLIGLMLRTALFLLPIEMTNFVKLERHNRRALFPI